MVRVANTGISSIIDNNGNIIERINIGKSGVIDKKLVLYKKNTLYTYIGDYFFYALLLVLVLTLINIKFKYGLKNKI